MGLGFSFGCGLGPLDVCDGLSRALSMGWAYFTRLLGYPIIIIKQAEPPSAKKKHGPIRFG